MRVDGHGEAVVDASMENASFLRRPAPNWVSLPYLIPATSAKANDAKVVVSTYANAISKPKLVSSDIPLASERPN